MGMRMQLDLFPTDLHLTCIDPAANKRRFYHLSIQPTLFGEWALVREWGRIGRGGGAERRDPACRAGADRERGNGSRGHGASSGWHARAWCPCRGSLA
jgi:predicted DNA-binding WGR domain protein